MAQLKKQREQSFYDRTQPQSKFINYELSKSEKEAIRKWGVFAAAPEDFIDRLGEQGYDVTIKMDQRSGGFSAWLRPNGKDHVNDGFILAGRGSTPIRALRDVCFKHFALFDGEHWPKSGDADFDDDF